MPLAQAKSAADALPPSRETTLALLLGASEFPHLPADCSSPAFRNSSELFEKYLLDTRGMGLDKANVLNLFGVTGTGPDIHKRIRDFLRARSDARDLVVHYVGHGDRTEDRKTYFLCLRDTEPEAPEATALTIRLLKESLGGDRPRLRQYLIIDACYAGQSVDAYQSIGLSAADQLFGELPRRGVSLLCAASRDRMAIAPAGRECTLFGEAMLSVLNDGDATAGPLFTLLDLKRLSERHISTSFPEELRRPEVHSPRQEEGAVADVPLFPNPKGQVSLIGAVLAETGRDWGKLWEKKGADAAIRKMEQSVPSASEDDWLTMLRLLTDKADARGAAVALAGLGHKSSKSVRSSAHRAVRAIQWSELIDGAVGRFDGATAELVQKALDGIEACRACSDVIKLLNRLVLVAPVETRPRVQELLREKRLRLGDAEVRQAFENAGSSYRIIRSLGEGALTIAYLAAQKGLDREVVIRVLKSAYAKEGVIRGQFLDVCKRTSRFESRHLVRIIDASKAADPGPCFSVHNYIRGETLDGRLRRGKRPSTRSALRILEGIAQALKPFHDTGAPHCGVRPSNIFLSREERRAVLGDPSLVLGPWAIRFEDTGVPADRLADDARYSAPEVYTGSPATRSDFYSLGCVAYELLCGKPPFEGSTWQATMLKHGGEPPVLPSQNGSVLGKDGDAVVLRLMAKSIDDRYRDVPAVLKALRSLRSTGGADSPSIRPVEPSSGPTPKPINTAGDSEPNAGTNLPPEAGQIALDMQSYLDKFNQGDPSAKNNLLVLAYDSLLNLARQLLRTSGSSVSEDDAGELLSEAYARLLASLDQARPRTVRDFMGMANLELRRILVDRHRQKSHRLGLEAEESRVYHSVAETDSRSTRHGVSVELLEAIEKLPDDEKEVAELLLVHGFSQPDAGPILGIDAESVKRRWTRARIKLAKFLTDTDLPPDKVSPFADVTGQPQPEPAAAEESAASITVPPDMDSIAYRSMVNLSSAPPPQTDAGPTPGPAESFPDRIGRYEIRRLIGRGGMGAVYLAHDPLLDRRIALKVVAEHVSNEGIRERSRREALALARMVHPNICQIFDVGDTPGGGIFIAMQFLEGETLDRLIRSRGISIAHSLQIVKQLTNAMQYAHDRGVIHRDLKPANVLIEQNGNPIILDFGLARFDDAPDTSITAVGAIMGTPSYMSPEQASGDLRAIGPAADIYSLGVVLFELVTGRRPFEGQLTELLRHVFATEAPSPSSLRPDLDPRFDAICRKALAKKPADRFSSMNEFGEAIADILSEPGNLLVPPHPIPIPANPPIPAPLPSAVSLPTIEPTLIGEPTRILPAPAKRRSWWQRLLRWLRIRPD